MNLSKLSNGFVLPLALVITLALDVFQVFTPAGRWAYENAAHWAYDWRWQKIASDAGAYDQAPLLVEIDDASVLAMGRWPWSRSTHATLLDLLNATQQKPSVVAFDVLFTEQQVSADSDGDPDGDALFARSIAASVKHFPVVLASQVSSSSGHNTFLRPKTPIATAGASLAVIQLPTDMDAAARRYQRIDSTLGDLSLPYLGVALFEPRLALPFPDALPTLNRANSRLENLVNVSTQRDEYTLLYPLPKRWVKSVSYESLRSGAVPSSMWANSPVLVAATANGLGDRYVSHIKQTKQVIAGGELVLGALHTEKMLAAGLPELSYAQTWLEWLCLILAATGVYFAVSMRLRMSNHLAVLVINLICVVSLVMSVFTYFGVWINPMPLIFASVLTWVLWLSSSLQSLIQHLLKRLAALRQMPANLYTPVDEFATAIHTSIHTSFHLPRNNIAETVQALTDLEQLNDKEYGRLNQVVDLLPDAAFVLINSQPPMFGTMESAAGTVDVTTQVNSASRPSVSMAPLVLRLVLSNRAAQGIVQLDASISQALAAPSFTLGQLLINFQASLTPAQTKRYAYFVKKQASQKNSNKAANQLDHQANSALSLTALNAAPSKVSPTLLDKPASGFDWNALHELHARRSFSHGVEATTPNGQRFLVKWVALSANKEANGAGHERTYILSIVDLSVSLALAQSREDTLNFLSHDIRAPQTTIMALLALEAKQHPELQKLFASIQFQAQRTLDLSESFVQWSQASHAPAYHWVEYNVNALIIEVLDEQWANAKQKGISLSGGVMDSLGKPVPSDATTSKELWVRIDRSLLWRALINLVSNALNAGHSGSAVTVSARQEGGHAVICVCDNGPGVPLAQQAQIFQPFVQGGGLKRHGAGLGLAFVKTVVDQHQGRINLHSPVFVNKQKGLPGDRGASFEIRLPLLEPSQVD